MGQSRLENNEQLSLVAATMRSQSIETRYCRAYLSIAVRLHLSLFDTERVQPGTYAR